MASGVDQQSIMSESLNAQRQIAQKRRTVEVSVDAMDDDPNPTALRLGSGKEPMEFDTIFCLYVDQRAEHCC